MLERSQIHSPVLLASLQIVRVQTGAAERSKYPPPVRNHGCRSVPVLIVRTTVTLAPVSIPSRFARSTIERIHNQPASFALAQRRSHNHMIAPNHRRRVAVTRYGTL